mgnify:CR=1 FL=1
MRRIGSTITIEKRGMGGTAYPDMIFEATDTGTAPTGTHFGVGALTGGAWQNVSVSSFEIRSLGDSASSIVNEVD